MIKLHPLFKNLYQKKDESLPVFMMKETLAGCKRHNVFGLTASLSFFSLFALIPMILLIFFFLSHWLVNSEFALGKLALLTSNLLPQISKKIMLEVFKISSHTKAWGILGTLILLWAATPLTSSLRASLLIISATEENPSFLKSKIRDIVAIIGILFLFFLFTLSGMIMQKTAVFFSEYLSFVNSQMIYFMSSFSFVVLSLSLFNRFFFPIKVDVKHIILGSLLTAFFWLLLRSTFDIFLSLSHSYGTFFGGMRNLFISLIWLYLNIASYLIGVELIATLHKKDMLLLKKLFDDSIPLSSSFIHYLASRYGKIYKQNAMIFEQGNREHNVYFIVQGSVNLIQDGRVIRSLKAHEYFGEMAVLNETPTIASAMSTSNESEIIAIPKVHLEMMLADEPKVAMKFLRKMSLRLQQR
jgi:membrane protein